MTARLVWLGDTITLESGHQYRAEGTLPIPPGAQATFTQCTQLDQIRLLSSALQSTGWSNVTVNTKQSPGMCDVVVEGTWSLPTTTADTSALSASGLALTSIQDLTTGTQIYPTSAPAPAPAAPPPNAPAPNQPAPAAPGGAASPTISSGTGTGIALALTAAAVLLLVATIA
jgi:hypothetical protein